MDFTHKLPSMTCGEKTNGLYNNPEIGYPCMMTTTDALMGEFIMGLRNIVTESRRLIFIDGKVIAANNNWMRDHVYIMDAFKHWEYDNRSFLDFILQNQTEKGFFYEMIKQKDDIHWSFVNKDCYKMYDDDNMALIRLELEADIEYLVVLCALKIYQTDGDIEYIRRILPKLEKGINYDTSDEKRWDKERGLVKRPFTVDTWDFTNEPNASTDRTIHLDKMSIMHGDNSGVYAAMKTLSFFRRKIGDIKQAENWDKRAENIKANMFKYLWNGNFFIHQLHINHKGIDNLENIRLSLSNTYDINRGVTDLVQSRKIISEYMRRRTETDAFAEWFTIEPPYEKFSKFSKGEYINGAISPFTGGELAKAAFENGFEKYGYDIIKRFQKLYFKDKNIYFLYNRKTGENQTSGAGPSAWGAAAILSAIEEGLAGIKDLDSKYDILGFSPRFAVTEYNRIRYVTGYEKSGVTVDVNYEAFENGMLYQVKSASELIKAHIMLPENKNIKKIIINDIIYDSFSIKTIGNTEYLDFEYNKEKTQNMKAEIYFS